MSALKNDGRPSAWETPSGRRVLLIIAASLIGAFMFLVFSNKVTNKAASAPTVVVSGNITEHVMPDGSTETTRGPNVAPAVPNAFSPGEFVGANAAQSDGGEVPTATSTDGPTPVASGTNVPLSDPGYRAAVSAAQGAIGPYCTWKYTDGADVYASSIPNLTDKFAANVKKSAVDAWPAVQRAKSSAKCDPLTARNITPVTYDVEGGVAVMNVQMVQDATVRGKAASRTVSYRVEAVKRGDVWQVDSITS